MREATTYPAMEAHFQAALRRNPFQAPTYRFPAGAYLTSRPAPVLTLDLYGRFRRDLDRGIRYDETSAEVYLTLARLETRALESLFHDSATRGPGPRGLSRQPASRPSRSQASRGAGRILAEYREDRNRRSPSCAAPSGMSRLRDRALLMTRFLLDLGKRGEALAS
jgi:hypothetical protein